MSQVRITKTPELTKVLDVLQQEYPLLNDAEIIKFSLSLAYKQIQPDHYWMTPEEEEGVGKALQELKEGKGFSGTVEEAITWLKE
ncbi:MAG: hypothetical protein P1V18_03965 [Candidatus Gracilibacteria bacterium]|nr:hypothetical protein [Candidatus Gracilibacteria bacterium]